MGNLEGAAELYRVIFQQAMDSGSTRAISEVTGWFCVLLVELGALNEAKSVIEQGVKAADQHREERDLFRALQAIVIAKKGNFVEARQVYDEADRIFIGRSRAWSAIWLSMAHANVLAAEKRWDEAFATFREAADLMARAEVRFMRSIFLQDWAQAHLERGQPEDLERTRELYREAISEFEVMGSPGYVARIQALLDNLDG